MKNTKVSIMKITNNHFIVWQNPNAVDEKPKSVDLDFLVKILWSIFKDHDKFKKILSEIINMETADIYYIDTLR